MTWDDDVVIGQHPDVTLAKQHRAQMARDEAARERLPEPAPVSREEVERLRSGLHDLAAIVEGFAERTTGGTDVYADVQESLRGLFARLDGGS